MEVLNLEKQFQMQRDLDKEIMKVHGIDYDKTRIDRSVALLVELGELCNETRCFKFWSFKGPSEKKVILEEYADAFHFFLSIGVSSDVNVYQYVIEPIQDGKPSELFLQTYQLVIDYTRNADEDHYVQAFTHFLNLGLSLGFTSDDILNAYHEKLNVNYLRQKNNY